MQNNSQTKSKHSKPIFLVFSEHLLNISVFSELLRNNSMKMKHGNEFENGGTQRVAKIAKVRISLLFFFNVLLPRATQFHHVYLIGWVIVCSAE